MNSTPSTPTTEASTPKAAATPAPSAKAPARKAASKPAVSKVATPKAPAAKKPAAKAPATKRTASKAIVAKPAAAKPVAAKPTKVEAKPKKPKLVRDSFTIPKDEYAGIDTLKERSVALGRWHCWPCPPTHCMRPWRPFPPSRPAGPNPTSDPPLQGSETQRNSGDCTLSSTVSVCPARSRWRNHQTEPLRTAHSPADMPSTRATT